MNNIKVDYPTTEKCYNHKKYTMCIIGYLLGRIKRLYPEYYILEEIKTIQN